MDLPAARKLATSLMAEHGLQDWHFAFDRARRRFGACYATRRTITLSARLVHLNTEAEVRDTILHEIAHALTPDGGHGPQWKAACRRIGAKPERCFKETDGVQLVRSGLRIGCAGCGWWVNRHRITWSMQVCRKCRKPVQWEHVGTGARYEIHQVPGGHRAIRVTSTPEQSSHPIPAAGGQ